MTKPSKTEFDALVASRERMEAIGEVARHIGHEYNNLFGIIISATGVLKEELADKAGYERVKPFIDDAESAAREGAELMASLLACSGSQGFATAATKPEELFETIVRQVRQDIPKNIVLDIALLPNPPAIPANPERLEGAIRNLLNNAIDAMPNGGTLRISSKVCHREDTGVPDLAGDANRFLAFSISDSGHGIEPELLKRVVQPFFTTREAGKRGLGLSLAYSYAMQTGGCLTIARNSGGGITTTLLLPVTGEVDASGAKRDRNG